MHEPAGPAAGHGGRTVALASASLAALVALRFALLGWHTMWAWGLNAPRFVAAPLALLAWLVMAAACIPALATRAAPVLASAGEDLLRSRTARLAVAAALALAVWALVDATQFTGDALIRAAASPSARFRGNFIQALPLEHALYEALPLALQDRVLPVGLLPRLYGAVAAIALALTALEFARACGARGAVLVAAWAVVAGGGALASFTGLGKPAAPLAVLVALAAAYAVRLARGEPGLGRLGLVTALAIVLHRAGALLLPAWALALAWGWRRAGPRSRALALAPVVALAVSAPAIVRIARTYDAVMHLGVAHPWRALDLANVALLMLPAAPALAIAAAGAGRAWRGRDAVLLVALAAPWLVLAVVTTPAQSLFRDLDFQTPGAIAVAALGAWALVRACAGAAGGARLAVTTTVVTFASTAMLLACFHDPAAGLTRVRAWLAEPPARSAAERANAWDFLALRAFGTRDWPLAAEASEQYAALAPHPRALLMLGIARSCAGDLPGARTAYTAMLARTPQDPVAWAGLAAVATRLGDRALADSAAARLAAIPGGTQSVAAAAQRYPEAFTR